MKNIDAINISNKIYADTFAFQAEDFVFSYHNHIAEFTAWKKGDTLENTATFKTQGRMLTLSERGKYDKETTNKMFEQLDNWLQGEFSCP